MNTTMQTKMKSFIDALIYKFGPKYRKSYSQCGEDIIVARLLRDMNIEKPFFIDIGANDPIIYNNTYLFYKNGARGICVEPNPTICKNIKRVRPLDTCLPIGIGTENGQGELYIISNNALSTFSKEEALLSTKEGHTITSTITVPIKTLTQIIKDCNIESVDYLSLDIEGLDFEVLKSFDFNQIKPKIICIETKSFTGERDASSIASFLYTKGYTLQGCTPINSIFSI
jgi:FkbM family methyltransferase